MADDSTQAAPPRSGVDGASAPCPNCGFERPGPFCPECGQRQGPRVLSMRRLLADAIEDQLSINSALPRTLRALFIRPGHLTTEYVEGRVARYIPPFRLYLVSSIVFFLALSLITQFRTPQGVLEIESDGETVALSERPTVVRADDGTFFGVRVDSAAAGDTTVILVNMGPRWVSELAVVRVRELSALPPEEIARALLPSMFARAPAGMFILLPVFAGMLKVAMVGRRRFYVEHFVFALHTHAFTFLLLSLVMVVNQPALNGIAAVGVVLYWFIAMKRFYRLGVAGAVLRGVPLLVAYQILLMVVLLSLLALAIVLG